MLALTKSHTMRRSGTLLILAVAGFLILKRLRARTSSLSSHAHVPNVLFGDDSSPVAELAAGNNNSESLEIQIEGYWKEVRASLGMPPLPDTFVVPKTSIFGVEDPSERLSGGSLSEGDRDEMYLRRIGKLNPALRRRRLVVNSALSRDKEIQRLSSQSEEDPRGRSRSSRLVDAENTRDYGLKFAHPNSESDLDSKSASRSSFNPPEREPAGSSITRDRGAYPDLFIAPDTRTAPRIPVGALAASFRAIAVREFKKTRRTGRGRTYLRHGKLTLQ